MARRRSYAFQRRGYTSPGDYQEAVNRGYDVMLAYDDPNLDQAFASARAAGLNPGLWADPHGRSPQEYVALMRQMYDRYRPAMVVPDLEMDYKGYQGSQGWQRNQQVADLWRQQMGDVPTWITPMGNQADFNYEAWNGIAQRWLPQAYGADPTKEVFDPQKMAQVLIDRGVDPSLIYPVVGPVGNTGYGGQRALWTLDDFQGKYDQLPEGWYDEGGQAGLGPARTTQGAGGPAGPRVPDAQNPRAVAYANQRLNQLRQLGWDIDPGDDPTAAWRQASTMVGAAAQKAGFQNPRDYLRTGNAPTQGKRPPAPAQRPARPPARAVAPGRKVVPRGTPKPLGPARPPASRPRITPQQVRNARPLVRRK